MTAEHREIWDACIKPLAAHLRDAPGDDVTGCSHCELTFDMNEVAHTPADIFALPALPLVGVAPESKIQGLIWDTL